MEERKDIEPYETICNNHNQIMWMLKQFKKTGDMWYVDQSIKLARYCKKQGQSLENRLYKWNDLVTRQMGYKRVYKPKKGKELKSWQK
jgi:gas vesicle protein